ncbi:MAG: UDP-N-acetylmuramoylalanyl-D-glutamyl-2,6-diaminopimelate--D-alanyl-D-alanine ligase [Alphaproteobacteria bacterium]|nr:UDP-N-acetylmuramoylalanyl-D-glutamyl-2,6-diaminopimelate--D-alanyl-D-alanine ligase [Alphaproteobacteria bacterium]
MADRPLWTIQEVLAATGGTLHGTIKVPMNAVSIDSRTLKVGDIFVAIRGDKMDGHDFVVPALKSGAGLAVVSRPTPEMLNAGAVLQVSDDPLQGLENMGRAARAWAQGQIIAITGSVGKTSTKEMLRVALSASGLTHASAASFNNHWGVPLTLSRMPRDAAYGVFEIGMNHAGEITPLVKMVRPHIAIVTLVAASHLGNFASLDQIAEAKAEIFNGLVLGGTAIINRDSPYFEMLAAAAKKGGAKTIIGFGHHLDADVRMERLALHPTCCCVTANLMGEQVVYKLGVPGEHMALNSLAVLAAVKAAGADLARAMLALADAAPAKGRGVQERLIIPGGDLLLIDESYNANPTSMAAALALLEHAKIGKNGRRIAVLGDMLELGSFGPDLHAGLAKMVDEHHIDVIYACGPLMRHLWDSLPRAKQGAYSDSSAALKNQLMADLRAGDAVMVKGSLGSKMGLVVDALRQKFTAVIKEN